MKQIHVLGSGCAKCNHLADLTKQAADELGIDYQLEKVTDFLKFADFGVMVTPALVVDGELIVSGRVPSLEEIKQTLSR